MRSKDLFSYLKKVCLSGVFWKPSYEDDIQPVAPPRGADILTCVTNQFEELCGTLVKFSLAVQ